MPHDIKGNLLEEGDIVTVRFRVKNVWQSEEACNITCESVEPMYPGTHLVGCTFNGRQVEKEDVLAVA